MGKRAKYVPKNIGAYKLPRKCHEKECDNEGTIVRNDRYTCIEHINMRVSGPLRKTPTELGMQFMARKQ